jgi:hypothetical protein
MVRHGDDHGWEADSSDMGHASTTVCSVRRWSDMGHASTTACSVRCWERRPIYHFKRLLKKVCLNHAYPVRHKLKDCGMMQSFMTSGTLA